MDMFDAETFGSCRTNTPGSGRHTEVQAVTNEGNTELALECLHGCINGIDGRITRQRNGQGDTVGVEGKKGFRGCGLARHFPFSKETGRIWILLVRIIVSGGYC
jgi:hypothetical protein